MIRAALAIIVGVAVTALLAQFGAIAFLLITVGIPLGAEATAPSPGGYGALLFGGALAAAVGGRVARRISRGHVQVAALSLSGALAVLAFWGFRQPGSQWPEWWAPALAVSLAAGASFGGLFGSHQRRNTKGS